MSAPAADDARATTSSERARIAELLGEAEERIAAEVTDEFLQRHPDWVDRYGAERARSWGVRDAVHHVQYLAGAVVVDAPEGFVNYGRWVAAMLEARGIAPSFLAENLQQVCARAELLVPEELRPWFARFADFDAADLTPDADAEATPEEQLLDAARSAYLQAAMRGDAGAAGTIVLEAVREFGLVETYIGVLEAAQRTVGAQWARAEITIEQEHIVTSVTQETLTRMFDELEEEFGAGADRGRIVIASVEGELHQVGMHIVADALQSRGWEVTFLGADVPTVRLLDTIERVRPAVVGLGTTILTNVPMALATLAMIEARFADDRPKLLLGGRAWTTITSSPQVDADAIAYGVRDALDIVERLTTSP